ncbi:MAG: HPP family protein [Gammaproteobacteria bacterium]|nr:HPP family protein [Gammaproteobacteria bacterium]
MPWFKRLFDFTPGSVSHTERLVSALGGFVSIFAILAVSAHYLGAEGALLIVPSTGATAVLLFAVPHGALSQPWNVLGGHLVSALVGVSCSLLVPQTFVAAGLAVGLAIAVMYYLRCIHPPGGATALAAVIGGESTHALGYQFVLTPVLGNTLIILVVAVLFNYPFKWRRYPAWLMRDEPSANTDGDTRASIEHADLVAALGQIDSYIDVSEHDLLRIYELATGQAGKRQLPLERILLGGYFSNGAFGTDWSVRQIVDQSTHDDPDRDMVVFKVVAGKGMRSSGITTRTEFAQWARHELIRDDENWKRVND